MRRFVILNTEFYAKSSYAGKSKVEFPIDAFEISDLRLFFSNHREYDFAFWFKYNASQSEKKANEPNRGFWWSRGCFASTLNDANRIFKIEQNDALICQLITIHKIPAHKYLFATNVAEKFATDLFILKKPYLMPFIQKFGEKELPENWYIS